jgi:hypothetical protein
VDFNPGSGTANHTAGTGISDAFVVCLTSAGVYSWSGQMGGTSVDAGQSICLDILGNVYTTGRFSGTADFDPGAGTSNVTSSGTYDVFISKLSSTGAFVWAHHIGGAANDVGNGIAVDVAENVYVTGYFAGAADMDPQSTQWQVTSAGQDDMMLVKFSQSGVGVDETATAKMIEVFPNPTEGPLTITCAGVDGPKTVRIISLTGEVLSQQMMSGATLLIDMSPFAEGTYFIEVTTETEVMFAPVVH